MSKDKRIRICPNKDCISNQTHRKYAYSDKYCTMCKSDLILVCRDCLTPIEDIGPDHIICEHCAAKKKDEGTVQYKARQAGKDAVRMVSKKASKVAETGAGLVDFALHKKKQND